MEDKSTPIESLHNNNEDESEVVNKILSKYNNLENNTPTVEHMENQFENRNLNKEIYDLNSNNVAYEQHYKKELDRTKNLQNNDYEDEYEEDDNEEEYEIIEIPLWRRDFETARAR